MRFPTIETERLVLSEFTPSHIDDLFDIFSNPSVTEFYDCSPFSDKSQAEQVIQRYIQQVWQIPILDFRWAITSKASGNKLIGTCGFHYLNKTFHSLEIGYDFHPSHWSRGYATEAVSAMIRYCLDHEFPFEINRITATTYLNASKSINVLKKLGFTEEGILRQYGYWKNAFHDVRLFSLLKQEVPNMVHRN